MNYENEKNKSSQSERISQEGSSSLKLKKELLRYTCSEGARFLLNASFDRAKAFRFLFKELVAMPEHCFMATCTTGRCGWRSNF